MSRVQSPNVAESLRSYLLVDPPSEMKVVPLILPSFEIPYKEYRFIQYEKTGVVADAWVVCSPVVPVDEDWLVTHLSLERSGDATFTQGLRVFTPSGMVSAGTGTKHDGYLYIVTTLAGATEYQYDFGSGLALPAGSYFEVYLDVTVTGGVDFVANIIRRKW